MRQIPSRRTVTGRQEEESSKDVLMKTEVSATVTARKNEQIQSSRNSNFCCWKIYTCKTQSYSNSSSQPGSSDSNSNSSSQPGSSQAAGASGRPAGASGLLAQTPRHTCPEFARNLGCRLEPHSAEDAVGEQERMKPEVIKISRRVTVR